MTGLYYEKKPIIARIDEIIETRSRLFDSDIALNDIIIETGNY
jgi:hypothetical protein